MTIGCARSMGRYELMDDRYNYSDELYNCLGETYISVMTSYGDTDLCANINTGYKQLS